jgi:hypothetical protein
MDDRRGPWRTWHGPSANRGRVAGRRRGPADAKRGRCPWLAGTNRLRRRHGVPEPRGSRSNVYGAETDLGTRLIPPTPLPAAAGWFRGKQAEHEQQRGLPGRERRRAPSRPSPSHSEQPTAARSRTVLTRPRLQGPRAVAVVARSVMMWSRPEYRPGLLRQFGKNPAICCCSREQGEVGHNLAPARCQTQVSTGRPGGQIWHHGDEVLLVCVAALCESRRIAFSALAPPIPGRAP